MNWPSARSSRASGPRSTVKRAPASFAAVAKSISPSASPSSKCCFGAKSRSRGSPCCFSTTLALSSGAVRHVGVEHVRQRLQDRADLAVQRRGRASPAPPSRRAAPCASASSAAVSAPRALALRRSPSPAHCAAPASPAAPSAPRAARRRSRRDRRSPRAPAPRRSPGRPDRIQQPRRHAAVRHPARGSSPDVVHRVMGLRSHLHRLRLDQRRRQDRDLVERDQRHRQADLA